MQGGNTIVPEAAKRNTCQSATEANDGARSRTSKHSLLNSVEDEDEDDLARSSEVGVVVDRPVHAPGPCTPSYPSWHTHDSSASPEAIHL